MFITRLPREMNIRLRKVFENGLRIVQWAAIVRKTMLSTLSNLSHARHAIRRWKRGQVCLLLLIRWYTLSPLKLSFIENAYIAVSIRRYPIHAVLIHWHSRIKSRTLLSHSLRILHVDIVNVSFNIIRYRKLLQDVSPAQRSFICLYMPYINADICTASPRDVQLHRSNLIVLICLAAVSPIESTCLYHFSK